MVGPDVKRTLIETLRGFDTLMVATKATNGSIHARPMAVAEVDDTGGVWFVTPDDSGKVDEITLDPQALVTGQDAQRYVSISGRLEIVHDPERVAFLWRRSWNAWHPHGARDPHVVLMRLRPEVGEFWLQGGLKGIRYLFEATRALLEGTSPREDAFEHAKVPM